MRLDCGLPRGYFEGTVDKPAVVFGLACDSSHPPEPSLFGQAAGVRM